MSGVDTDKLLKDLRTVIHDAEELLRVTAGQAGEHIAQARAKAEASQESARRPPSLPSGSRASLCCFSRAGA
jgi:ElaB/YqjD/DUF883 family membrane-anchored ribosome-binding protein